MTEFPEGQAKPPDPVGWRKRAFAIAGILNGVVVVPLVIVLTRKLDAVYGFVVFVIYVGTLVPIVVFLWNITRKVRCPKCSSNNARLTYDDNRDEYVTCFDCSYRKATGYAQPND